MTRSLTLSILILTILSACTIRPSSEKEISESQYPSIPLGVSTEIGLPNNAARGGSFTARGTEPFWSVDITPGKAILSTLSETGTLQTSYTISEEDKGGIIILQSVKGDFFVNLIKGECSDGMSEESYQYNVTVLYGNETLKGCGKKK